MVSPGSPLGQALLGHGPGTRWNTRPRGVPQGRDRQRRDLRHAATDRRPGAWSESPAAPARSPRRSGTPMSSVGGPGEPDVLYVDLHLVHEVTSPQAFDGLRMGGRGPPARPDHRHDGPQHADVDIDQPVADPISPSSSPRWPPTAPSSASPTTRWATRTRASFTSSGPSRASPSRA